MRTSTKPLLKFRWSTLDGEGDIVEATTAGKARKLAHQILVKSTDNGVYDWSSIRIERMKDRK